MLIWRLVATMQRREALIWFKRNIKTKIMKTVYSKLYLRSFVIRRLHQCESCLTALCNRGLFPAKIKTARDGWSFFYRKLFSIFVIKRHYTQQDKKNWDYDKCKLSFENKNSNLKMMQANSNCNQFLIPTFK